MGTARVVAPYKATATLMGGFSEPRAWDGSTRDIIPPLGFYTLTIYDALVCLTACYPKKFGPRGIGHAGVMWIGLQCDIEDEGYASPPYSYATIRHYFSLCVCACVLPLCPFVNPNWFSQGALPVPSKLILKRSFPSRKDVYTSCKIIE